MSETRNIVVLGASLGGLSAAHYLAKHTLPELRKARDVKYELHLVDQSTHFWWHVSAPRAIVSVEQMKHADTFVPIMEGFKQYTNLKDSIKFHHATITGLDTSTRNVLIRTSEGNNEELSYHALIIATGINTHTPLTSLQGDHTVSQRALEQMNSRLATAKDIVVGGGGPVGVETAGELGAHLQGKAKITLLTASKKLLPVLRQSLSDKVQRQLENVGVTVRYGTRIQGSQALPDGRTEIKLENGETMTADVYIPAVGVTPSTDFLPADLKESSGYVKSNPETLRVDVAGSRVYAVGDVSGVDKGGVLNFFNSFPVASANISRDLLSEVRVEDAAEIEAKRQDNPEKKYQRKDTETQLVPVGPKTGVGAFNGWQMPGFAVSLVKGRNYMTNQIPQFTEGKKWVKA